MNTRDEDSKNVLREKVVLCYVCRMEPVERSQECITGKQELKYKDYVCIYCRIGIEEGTL